MKVLSKIQLVVVVAIFTLFSASIATAYAQVYPITPPVEKGQPITPPKYPVKPISPPENSDHPVHPEMPITPPGLNL